MLPYISRLYVSAASFDELLSERFRSLPGQKADADRAAARLAEWCRQAASGDWGIFAKRIERDGWTLDFILSRFATAEPVPDMPPPQWLQDAEWIITTLSAGADGELSSLASGRSILPFEEFLHPIIGAARHRRDQNLSTSAFAASALADLDYQLAYQLADLMMIALYAEFDAFRADGIHYPDGGAPLSEGDNVNYRTFIGRLQANPSFVLIDRYPVLVRLIATLTRQWIDSTSEFIERLTRDQPLIAATFPDGVADGPVTNVTGGLSDVHNGGRSVLILTFPGGGKLLYKPKDLAADQGWSALVSALNAAGPPIDLRAAKVLPRAGYGWSEFVEADACRCEADVKAFYRRSGAWLALFHLVCATDMHEENIIASGAHPVPIDLEMILQPELHDPDEQTVSSAASLEASRKISRSVISVGLLPGVFRAPDTRLHGIGGIGRREAPESGVRLEPVNTDNMQPTPFTAKGNSPANLPRLNGEAVPHTDYIEAILCGFVEFAAFLTSTAGLPALIEAHFTAMPARIVLRTTRFYAMLLSRLKSDAAWGDGVLWSVQADFVSRFASQRSPEPSWPLYGAERRALLDLNIPHFTCRTDTTTIEAHDGVRADLIGTSGLAVAHARIGACSVSEIDWQRRVAALGLDVDLGGKNYFALGIRRSLAIPPVAYSPSELVERSAAIAGQLAAMAIMADGTVAWIGLCNIPDTESYQLVPLGFDLHSGVSGLGFYLAAHASVTGDESARRLAMQAFAGLRQLLRDRGAARFIRASGLGGALGLGSYIYALTAASQFLNDSELLDDARHAASLITHDLLEADREFDVTGGAGGAILGLLKLYRLTNDPEVLDTAIQCGNHLLAKRVEQPGGLRLWPYLDRRAMTGFSHGASGYAFALMALARTSGHEEFSEAANEALAYEARLYSPENGNWPDFRDFNNEKGSFHACQWCHGAGGIGLSRLGIARHAPKLALSVEREIETALKCVQLSWPNQADSLCCGNLGTIQFLADVGRHRNCPALVDTAHLYLRSIVEDAERNGTYCWGKGPDIYNLGLFSGLAGVGYSLLRQLDETLPNPLLWE